MDQLMKSLSDEQMAVHRPLRVVIEAIENNIESDIKTCQKACEMLLQMHEAVDEIRVLRKLDETLSICLLDENIFCCIVEFMLNRSRPKMELVLSLADIKTSLVKVLLQGFAQFLSVNVLQKIASVLCNIVSWSPETSPKATSRLVFEAVEDQYADLLQAEASWIIESKQAKDHQIPAIKMSILLRSFIAQLLDYFQFEAVTIINIKHLQDPNSPNFPIFARLHTDILRTLWRILREEDDSEPMVLPYDLNFVVNSVSELTGKLLSIIHRRDLHLLHAKFVFTALMELLYEFHIPPTIVDEGKRCILLNNQKITNEQMMEIVMFAEFYVFNVDMTFAMGTGCETFYDDEFQKEMLLSLTRLIKNNRKIPNVSAVFKVVQYFSAECKFKSHLEQLMKVLVDRASSTFSETIALTLLHLAKNDASHDQFLGFTSSLDEFFRRATNNAKRYLSVKEKVTIFILSQLTSFVRAMKKTKANNNRLMLLDFLPDWIEDVDFHTLSSL